MNCVPQIEANGNMVGSLCIPPSDTIYVAINAFSLYSSGILRSTVLFLDLKDIILFKSSSFLCFHFHYFANTLCMYIMSLTDYFDGTRSQFHLI